MDPRQIQATRIFTQSTPVTSIESDRVALICYGHLRSFLFCMPEALKWASQFGTVDIYMHTWDKINYDAIYDHSLLSFENLIKAISVDYNLVSLAIDKQPETQFSAPSIILENPWYFMYYSMWVANSLKKQVENDLLQRYPLCIKLRPDIFINSKMEKFSLEKSEYFFSAENSRHSDVVAVTHSRTMDLICSFLGQITDKSTQADVQAKHYDYLCKNLKLAIAPISYGKDWFIVRNEVSMYS